MISLFTRPLHLILICLSTFFYACQSKEAKDYENYLNQIQKSRHENGIGLVADSVIVIKANTEFKGLNYFDVDTQYRVKAQLTLLPPLPVTFKTTTERAPLYYVFALLKFKIGLNTCQLLAYSESEKNPERLFIPFKDQTNRTTTYGGGRYLDLPYQGEKSELTLDFNLAYNPYCHYNHGYSCPLVPDENKLNVSIQAGEKKFND